MSSASVSAFRGAQRAAAVCGLLFAMDALHAHPRQVDIPIDVAANAAYAYAVILDNSNVVVVDPDYGDAATPQRGVVYLVGSDHRVISTLKGVHSSDRIGSGGVTLLTNGNFVVQSPQSACDDGTLACGAATWVDGRTGLSGTVTSANSLMGGGAGDRVGESVLALKGGDYLVRGRGASIAPGNVGTVTLGNGSLGSRGVVAKANSWTGASSGDDIGEKLYELPNSDIVLLSPKWNLRKGALTQIDRTASAFTGVVSEENSLTNGSLDDVTILSNGNYVVCSTGVYLDGQGAVTWVNAKSPRAGQTVSTSNSYYGDRACERGVVALKNGNFVAVNERSVTWGNGVSGGSGKISLSNSLFMPDGSAVFDRGTKVVPLDHPNGNYVAVFSWAIEGLTGGFPDKAGGFVVWADGRVGVTGKASPTNAQYLSGSLSPESSWVDVVPLKNGHYVVSRPFAADRKGMITWGNGSTGGSVGIADPTKSLLGMTSGDLVGLRTSSGWSRTGILPLTDGDYVVTSTHWGPERNNRGAVTWVNGGGPVSGQVSLVNSLIGPEGAKIGSGGVIALRNGNYFINSPDWNGGRGGWTWGGDDGVTRGLLAASSVVEGRGAFDSLGYQPSIALPDGRVLGVFLAEAVCEYAGTAPISGGPNGTYCVELDPYIAGGSSVAAPRSSAVWAVLRPGEQLLTVVEGPDHLFANGFD